MSRNYRSAPTSFASGIAAPEADPSGAAAGVAIPDDAGPSECVWFLTGGTSGTVEFWYYDSASGVWCSGGTASVVGNQAVKQYLYGTRIMLTFSAIAGTYAKSYQLVSSGG